ncbi:GNAT family N-acetyltransferase [Fictibacillus barbaricus]|uniref:GNAT superfamily N-acetyltransferase n=1 Tax=Fictibacillus barbaricus TaxID=182136 RepID=A0ABU1TXP8_9BACL|nr:GNAT family N-acetyltransferase [Fictibacillus barbaricus]MDR7071985.1 GNAT superfamily N-acetyltransferase [Fictibacillus barbaricus]
MKIYRVTNDVESNHIEEIAQLFLQQRTMNGEPEEYSRTITGIKLALENPDKSGIIVAEDEGSIIGLAFFNLGVSIRIVGPYLWLNDLFVHEEHRNRGIARKLLLHLIYWAERDGIKSIELETGINNSVTKHLYNSLDFHDIISKRYAFHF